MAAKAKTGFSGLDKSKTLAENTVNAGPVVLDSNVTFTSSSPNVNYRDRLFLVEISNRGDGDHISIENIGGITVSDGINNQEYANIYYNGHYLGNVWSNPNGYLIVELAWDATGDGIGALARAISYSYLGDAPPTGPRTITFKVSDSSDTLSTATMLLKLKPENDAPVFSGLDAQSVHSTSQAAAGVVIDADAHVTNPDLTGFKAGKLSVHLAGATASDQLYLADGDFSITGKKLYLDGKQVGTVSADGLAGHDLAFTLKGAISDAQMSALMEQVSYRSTAASAPDGARDVTFTVTDAEKSAASAHVSLVFEADAPTLLSAAALEADPLATLKAAVACTSDDLSDLFAGLEARAAGLLEAASQAHGSPAWADLPDLHLPAAVEEYLDAIGASALDHLQAAHPALLHELADRAEVLVAHVHEVLHPAQGHADGLI